MKKRRGVEYGIWNVAKERKMHGARTRRRRRNPCTRDTINDMFNYVEPLFRPPAEARSLIFQVMYGCSANSCRFCGMYKGKLCNIRPVQDVLQEIETIPSFAAPRIFKVFLADGDALHTDPENLERILTELQRKLPRLRRVSAYATPGSILRIGKEALLRLRMAGLQLLYVGLESGHDPLLKAAAKQNTASDYVAACRLAHLAGMKLSVTAILGLGGREFTMGHATDTARAVTDSAPEFFSLLTLIPGGNEGWIKDLDLLTRGELISEARRMIAGIDVDTIFRTNHGSNFVDLGGTLQKDKAEILARADAMLSRKDEPWMREIPQFMGEFGY